MSVFPCFSSSSSWLRKTDDGSIVFDDCLLLVGFPFLQLEEDNKREEEEEEEGGSGPLCGITWTLGEEEATCANRNGKGIDMDRQTVAMTIGR